MQMSRPVLPDQSFEKAWNSAPERAWDRALGWLERQEHASVFGPLFAYARAHASQLFRFVLIGAGLAALNLSLLYCLRALLHFSDPIAVTAMYIVGALIHFPAHRWITYGAQDRPIRPQGLRYAVMLVCNFLILQALVALGSRVSISPYIAFMGSTGCTMVFNFLVMTHIVFAKRASHAAHRRPARDAQERR
jgi:putative flippase GtrA